MKVRYLEQIWGSRALRYRHWLTSQEWIILTYNSVRRRGQGLVKSEASFHDDRCDKIFCRWFYVSPVVVATGREEIVAIFTGVLHMQGSPERGLIVADRFWSFNIFGGSYMFRNACGRSNDTESWGQCKFFFFCKSVFLRFCLNKKKIKMWAEIVTVCTSELTGHGFQTTGFATAISKMRTRLTVRPSSVCAVEVHSALMTQNHSITRNDRSLEIWFF